MKIIGCDFHPSFQQIAMVDTETGEHTEKRLTPEEAVKFYGQLRGEESWWGWKLAATHYGWSGSWPA